MSFELDEIQSQYGLWRVSWVPNCGVQSGALAWKWISFEVAYPNEAVVVVNFLDGPPGIRLSTYLEFPEMNPCRTPVLACLLSLAAIVDVASASSTPLALDADCDGWSMNGWYGSGPPGGGWVFFQDAVLKCDANMNGPDPTDPIVASSFATFVLPTTNTGTQYFSPPTLGEQHPWEFSDVLTPGAQYYAELYQERCATQDLNNPPLACEFPVIEEGTSSSFTCVRVNQFTPGFWKNHPEVWPVSSLTLGGISYTQRELLAILMRPTRGDITIILSHHLIAAMLNIASGSDPSIQGTIDDANTYLSRVPLGSRPRGGVKALGERLKTRLDDYNNGR